MMASSLTSSLLANDQNNVSKELMELIEHYVATSKGINPKDACTRANTLYHYSLRILSSRLPENPILKQNTAMVADDLLVAFAGRESTTQKQIDEASNLLTKFLTLPVHNKSAVLCLLKQLMDDGKQRLPNFVPSMLNTPSPTITLSPTTTRPTPPTSKVAPVIKKADQDEAIWIRDLTFVFQGVNGAHIHFDEKAQIYAINNRAQVTLTAPQCELVLRLAELGALYKPVGQFVSEQLDLVGTKAVGHVAQAFVAAVQECLSGYFRSIAALENRLLAGGITLKKVWLWAQDPIQTMRMLHVLVKLSKGQKGGALVSMIHTYTNHGDPFVRQFNEKLLGALTKPYFRILVGWISHGELDDPHEEIFIQENGGIGADSLWKARYTVRPAMMASFINKTTAKKMFLIGKNLNFAKICCSNDTEWLREHAQATIPRLSKLQYDPETLPLESLVEEIYVETSRHVLDLLYDTYHLESHFRALYQFLLLQQGDFVQYLMDNLHSELDKPAESIFRHDLVSVLDSAVPATNAQFALHDALKRLDVRLLDPEENDSGWEVFTLDYHVDSPLDTILSPPVLQQYQKLFRFLWRTKRIEYAITISWKLRQKAPLYGNRAMVAMALATANHMQHFVRQFQSFIQLQVIETSWREFSSVISQREGDIDSVISAHNRYLNSISSKASLTDAGQQQTLSVQLSQLFALVLDFVSLEPRLYESRSKVLQKYGVLNLGDGGADWESQLERTCVEFSRQLQDFVLKLSSSSEAHLKSLYLSLDYNEYFKQSCIFSI